MRDNSQIVLTRSSNINLGATVTIEIGYEGSGSTAVDSTEWCFLRFGMYADQICQVDIQQQPATAMGFITTATFTMLAAPNFIDVYSGAVPLSDGGIYTLSWPRTQIQVTNLAGVNTTAFEFIAVIRKWR